MYVQHGVLINVYSNQYTLKVPFYIYIYVCVCVCVCVCTCMTIVMRFIPWKSLTEIKLDNEIENIFIEIILTSKNGQFLVLKTQN